MTESTGYPMFKQRLERIECASCHMGVMLRGDRVGWKPLNVGGSQLWYCEKESCQQQRELLLARVQAGNLPMDFEPGKMGQLLTPDGTTAAENRVLKQRITELETELTKLRQSTAAPPPPVGEEEKLETVTDGIHWHIDNGKGKPLCGAKDAEHVKKDDAFDITDEACDACIDTWSAIREGRQKRGEDVLSEPPAAAAVMEEQIPIAPPPPPPIQLDASKATKFSADLLSTVNDGADPPEVILLTQKTYPSIDFENVRPTQLTSGISGFFKAWEVDTIQRAEDAEGKLLGFAFTLKRRADVEGQT